MIDLIILAVFVAYGIYAGLANRRFASRSLEDYFLAGRSLSGWRAGLSMAATQFAADTPLLVMGMLAVSGVSSLWRLWIYGLAFLLMGFLLGSAWQRAGVLTDAELTMIRYSHRGALTLRLLKAVYYGTVVNCVVLAFVLVAGVRIFEVFLPWHLWLDPAIYQTIASVVREVGVEMASGTSPLPAAVATTNNLLSLAAMLLFVAFYSATGGLRSVVNTDVAQLAFMLLGTLAYAVVAVHEAGGMTATLHELDVLYGAEAERLVSFVPGEEALTAFLVVVSLQWLFQLNSDGTGYLAQRSMACMSERDSRLAATVFTFTQILVRSLMWLAIGLALLVLYPFDPAAAATEGFIAERELVFVRGMDELLPAGLRGLMLTGMLAALASTLDTHLNWGASYWSNDLYRGWWLEHVVRREARPHELVLVARLANVVLIALALAIMVQLDSIQSAWHLSLLFGAGIGAVLVLRWLWERVNLYSEIAAIVVSLAMAPLLLATVADEWQRLALMALSSTVAVVAAALWLPGTESHRLEAFYRRVRPPGWWGTTAQGVGEDVRIPRQRLVRGTLAIAACAMTVYGSLVGLGQVMMGRAGLSTAVALLLAVLGVPVWLRYLRRGGDVALRGPR